MEKIYTEIIKFTDFADKNKSLDFSCEIEAELYYHYENKIKIVDKIKVINASFKF
jgi:hypothetical protein